MNNSNQYDISSDLELAINNAKEESHNRATLVGEALGYAEGIEYLYRSGFIKTSQILQNTIKEIKTLCIQFPTTNEEIDNYDHIVSQIQLFSKKLKALVGDHKNLQQNIEDLKINDHPAPKCNSNAIEF